MKSIRIVALTIGWSAITAVSVKAQSAPLGEMAICRDSMPPAAT